jgi:hypothetical protein
LAISKQKTWKYGDCFGNFSKSSLECAAQDYFFKAKL